jgi:hypothetical protein
VKGITGAVALTAELNIISFMVKQIPALTKIWVAFLAFTHLGPKSLHDCYTLSLEKVSLSMQVADLQLQLSY